MNQDQYQEAFFQAYVETMLWANTWVDGDASTDGPHSEDLRDKRDLVTAEALESMREETDAFVEAQWEDLRGLDAGQSGHDFALTRNSHGAGFWDRGYGEKGDRLTAACKPYGAAYLSLEDDKIEVM